MAEECKDCIIETRFNLGLYDYGVKVPRNLRQRFKEAYEDEYYRHHDQKENKNDK